MRVHLVRVLKSPLPTCFFFLNPAIPLSRPFVRPNPDPDQGFFTILLLPKLLKYTLYNSHLLAIGSFRVLDFTPLTTVTLFSVLLNIFFRPRIRTKKNGLLRSESWLFGKQPVELGRWIRLLQGSMRR